MDDQVLACVLAVWIVIHIVLIVSGGATHLVMACGRCLCGRNRKPGSSSSSSSKCGRCCGGSSAVSPAGRAGDVGITAGLLNAWWAFEAGASSRQMREGWCKARCTRAGRAFESPALYVVLHVFVVQCSGLFGLAWLGLVWFGLVGTVCWVRLGVGAEVYFVGDVHAHASPRLASPLLTSPHPTPPHTHLVGAEYLPRLALPVPW